MELVEVPQMFNKEEFNRGRSIRILVQGIVKIILKSVIFKSMAFQLHKLHAYVKISMFY